MTLKSDGKILKADSIHTFLSSRKFTELGIYEIRENYIKKTDSEMCMLMQFKVQSDQSGIGEMSLTSQFFLFIYKIIVRV